MEISQIYQRSDMSQLMVQQFAAHQASASCGNTSLIPGPSSYAIAGELGVLPPEESFNINNIDKVTKTNKSEELTRLGTVKSQYYEPVLSFRSFMGSNILINGNSSLSFMRGELGANIPLNEDAIYTNGGYLAANLNLIG